jgi:carbamoylphosphate synthase small subunit
MKKVFVVDNYDSFTYNLVHYLKEFKAEVKVCRNDKFDLIDLLDFNKILLSPGPGIPDEAGKLKEVIKKICKFQVNFRSLSWTSSDRRSIWRTNNKSLQSIPWNILKNKNR